MGDPYRSGPAESLFSLEGRSALVTGASDGLGAHFAKLLARSGAHVALAGRRQEKLQQVSHEIRAGGGRAVITEMDVTSQAGIERAFDAAEDAAGTIDLLINNAGIVESSRSEEIDQHEWDNVFHTNLRGAFQCSQAFAKRLIGKGRGGAIVNISSILGLRQAGNVTAYAASKAALIQMSRSLALEWARHAIRVNVLAPGYIETPFNADFLRSPAGQALLRRIPQRRAGRPEDLDGPLLLLCSDASRFMTGSMIVADGGHLVSSL